LIRPGGLPGRPSTFALRSRLAVLAVALALAPASLLAAPPALPRLTGVAVGPDYRAAIFASPDGSWVVAGEGDRVGGFTVLRIIPGGAEVAGPDDRWLLVPEPDRASACAAVQAAGSVPPESPERCHPVQPILIAEPAATGRGGVGGRNGMPPAHHH
jgi:hypothetical protein